MPLTILLPVDGSAGSLNAAHHVIRLNAITPDLQVHLVNVQSPGDDWGVRRMIKPEELARMEQEWAEAAMEPARRLLQAAGVNHDEHLAQGEVAPTIVRLAHELNCDQIVMGTRGQSALGGLLMGSVATKVLHSSSVPVTLVK